jgi:hypothetical protein
MRVIILAALILTIFISCRDEISSPDNRERNLITNSSFELNNRPTLKGWITNGNVNYSRDVPRDGGIYSIVIDEAWGPPGYVSYSVLLEQGTRVYIFDCWAKAGSVPAEISFIHSRDTILTHKIIEVKDSIWKSYSYAALITAGVNDTIKIFLKGSRSHLASSKTYYDRCTLRVEN